MVSDIGNFILEHRTARNLSTRKLAALADISHTEIHRLENGERKNPSPLVLKCIANALDLPYEDIMRAAGYMDIASPSSATTTRLSGINDLTDQEIEEVNNFIEFLHNKRNKQNSKF
ncbi:MAG: helix-turn-helix domain-containing protein [Clostridium sp.]|uniref:helix-turn-helix domain-containing protein n=1 Tax=Clostridium sp. TaxID=1506 RepID=UPI003D6C9B39